jgi:hypothetical protein
MSVVCCQVDASASGRSLVQRSPTKCGVSECDREASILKRLWQTRGLLRHWKKNYGYKPMRSIATGTQISAFNSNGVFQNRLCLRLYTFIHL